LANTLLRRLQKGTLLAPSLAAVGHLVPESSFGIRARIEGIFLTGDSILRLRGLGLRGTLIRKWLPLGVLALALLPNLRAATKSHPAPALLPAQGQSPERVAPRNSVRPIEEQHRITAYTLPPDQYQKARTLGRIHFLTNLANFFYGLFVFWLILQLRLAPKFRDWAEKTAANSFVQAFVFTTVLIVTVSVLESPTAIYEHVVSRKYGLSVEGWGALAWDWTKGIFLFVAIGSILAWILYGVIRRSPRKWWFYFWLISVPLIVFLSFVEPFVLEPMFFTFAPLDQKDPALVAQIERVAQRAGLSIPPDRMLWMKASDKTPTMNAYVSGIGASKRIVVWDTSVEKETTPEIVSVVGHEMGHYVLGHVWKGLLFSLIVMLILLFLGYRSVGWALARWGQRWSIRGLGDWASLPVLLLLLSIFSFLSDPITNAYSRFTEHQADVYGVEVTHGILPDAAQAAADSFQLEGASSLAEPDPSRLNVFLFYDHPPISERVRFLLHYNPWSAGEPPEFVK
jgi:STE24 endopeptidase